MKLNLKHPLSNQRGVSLIEVIVVMVIVVILIMISAVGISLFFRKYQELNAWADLQKDGLECLNTIKNGIAAGTGNNVEFLGVNNAIYMRLLGAPFGATTGNAIKVTPPTKDGLETTDYAQFFLYDNAVRATYVHRGIQISSPVYLFPKRDKLDTMTLEKFQIKKVNQGPELIAIEVTLHGKVKTGKDAFRYIKYKTKMVKK
ncbi:MAG: prepilin-type N-terminal cleavage/methylation domain-containing protein [Candidatus Cloacimonadaceae bacterium]|nr:prepilin-type N-terminal cleavage/methylation domain-containing protein [Candidatus Cloacimonadaceae bacterium]MDP3113528.1 prepilin-type N-terminal cleavage/methylation domain-containing protein [Candidatus Cloacimonadaceae bacterium]